MSDELNYKNKVNEAAEPHTLTADEAYLIAAYRAGDAAAVLKTAMSKDTESHMDAAERIALAVLGELGSRSYLKPLALKDAGLTLIWQDIADAVRRSLLIQDIVELEQMRGG